MANEELTTVKVEAQVSGVDKVDALTNSLEEGGKQAGKWADEEERLSGTVEAGKRRQQAATEDLLATQRRGADETAAASKRTAAGIDEIGRASEGARSKSVESSDAITRGVRSISEEIGTLKSVYLRLLTNPPVFPGVRALEALSDDGRHAIAASVSGARRDEQKVFAAQDAHPGAVKPESRV